MAVFVDTSYFVARLVAADQWHARAASVRLPASSLVTSSLVINETVSLLQAHGRFSTALAFLRVMRRQERTRIVHPDEALQERAWELFVKYGPSGATAVDCVSFALMLQLSIREVLTFDAHFRLPGFRLLV